MTEATKTKGCKKAGRTKRKCRDGNYITSKNKNRRAETQKRRKERQAKKNCQRVQALLDDAIEKGIDIPHSLLDLTAEDIITSNEVRGVERYLARRKK